MSDTPRTRRMRQLMYMKKYLADLSALLGRDVLQDELGPVEQVQVLQAEARKLSRLEKVCYEMAFAGKKDAHFKKFIGELFNANSLPVYLWASHVEECGLLLLPSIRDMNFDFSFDVDGNGVISLVTYDFKDGMLLDFFIDDGSERLIIEVQGEHWRDIPLEGT